MTAIVSKGPMLGMRHLQTFLLFLNIVVVYISRVNIGIALVAMTNAATTNPDFPEYDWNGKQTALIISSFFWGYVITQFPGGYLARRFGCKITMFVSTFGSAVFTLAIPFCVPWGGWQIYCAIRIMQGLFLGVQFPCVHVHLAKWAPPDERNRLGALSHTGIECGSVLAMFVTGLIAASSLGWPGISYVSAGLCFAWCLIWWILGADNPPSSKFISTAEREYIETSLRRPEGFHEKKIPVPWLAIFTSIPFYALLVARCAEGWGFTTVQAEIPSYMANVLNMEIKSNAIFSALPFMAMWIMSFVYVIVADVVMTKKLLSLSLLRKIINSFAFWVPAAGLIGVSFLDENNKTLAIVLLTTSMGFNAGSIIGSSLNTLDLSPNHAGILMAIVNPIANFVMLLTPLVSGAILTDKTDPKLWQIVFVIAAVIFFAGNLFYIIFSSAEKQDWDAEDYLLKKYSIEAKPHSFDDQTSATDLKVAAYDLGMKINTHDIQEKQ